MGRLTNLRPQVSTLPSALARPRDPEGHSKVDEPWRAWYWLARWKRLRIEIFVRDGFRCQCGCNKAEGRTRLLVCDHIKPHRGDEALFWDPDNLQTMLKTCHDRIKQAAEKAFGGG